VVHADRRQHGKEASMSGMLSGFSRAPGRELRVAEAVALIEARLPVVARAETVPLAAAAGRILSDSIVAPLPLPPFDHVAVDGYAMAAASLEAAGGRLPVTARVAAGDVAAILAEGGASRVFTGAPLPAGADTVVMQEDVSVDVSQRGRPMLVVPPGVARRDRNIRRRGEEFAEGAEVLPAGRRIGPAELALAASLGRAEMPVHERLRVALFSTGNELLEPGAPCGAAGRYDSNRPMLAAMLERLGCVVSDFGIVRDEPAALRAVFERAAPDHHAVLSSGGVSVGEEDHIRTVLAQHGEGEAWVLAMKPGRMLALGLIAGTPVIGLPGNPVAAMHAFVQIARPALLRLAGASRVPLWPLPVPAGFSHRKRAGRLEALRVRLGRDAAGQPVLQRFGSDSSGWLSSLTEGDGLAILPEPAGDVAPGDAIGFLPFFGLL
jgi:molybdopterin molybdotransferase